ncbi:unnamed protein product [Nesidiocoris tenuis]|uniref:Uncharacterized protein n=1 Tax=Nesidiocoris tenuis TaxID=355587 RepID=A0A6H5GTR0_9HEMI|nr:unnamed protein product [Nesidiocoris tenuis]CAB0006160.1 unnamed protein product [Nesidiocoris tenuis]
MALPMNVYDPFASQGVLFSFFYLTCHYGLVSSTHIYMAADCFLFTSVHLANGSLKTITKAHHHYHLHHHPHHYNHLHHHHQHHHHQTHHHHQHHNQSHLLYHHQHQHQHYRRRRRHQDETKTGQIYKI